MIRYDASMQPMNSTAKVVRTGNCQNQITTEGNKLGTGEHLTMHKLSESSHIFRFYVTLAVILATAAQTIGKHKLRVSILVIYNLLYVPVIRRYVFKVDMKKCSHISNIAQSSSH